MGIIPADFICVLVILLAGITYFSYCHEVQVVIDFDQLPGRHWCIFPDRYRKVLILIILLVGIG